jgi:hypothetical protein
MVCLRNISVDTLHKGDTEDDDDDNNERIACLLIYMRISADTHVIKEKLKYCNTHGPCNRSTA